MAENKKKRIVMYGDGTVAETIRVQLVASEIERRPDWQYEASVISLPPDLKEMPPIMEADLVVFSRIAYPPLLDQYKMRGIPIIYDLDDCFHLIGPAHPGYKWVGRGNPKFLDAMDECIKMANILTVATPELAEFYYDYNRTIRIIPNGWSEADNWQRYNSLDNVSIGWAGTITHLADFQLCLPALRKTMKDFPDARIIIGGDPKVYALLAAVPESQKLFLPMVRYEDYPYIINMFDVLLAPLEDTPFNRMKSDIKLVDAGASAKPFVASPLPVYKRWEDGGMYADNQREWYDALSFFANDWQERRAYGNAGYHKAQSREIRTLIGSWLDVYEHALMEAS